MQASSADSADITLRYIVLDSWRGIAALMVVLFHFPSTDPILQSAFVRSGYLFVDFFFVLSGFVIAAGYSYRLSMPADIRRFVMVRFGRLYPLHVFVLAAFVAFEILRGPLLHAAHGDPVFEGRTDPAALVANLFLLQGTGIMDRLTWNEPSWSISTEFFAYLGFAALVYLLGRRSWIALAAVVVAAPVVILTWSPNYMFTTYDYGLIRCFYGFALGALLSFFAGAGIRAGKRRLESAGVGQVALWSAAEIAIVAAIFGFVAWVGKRPESVASPFVFVVAIYLFAHEGGIVSRLLRGGLFLWLGAISYSVYMIHVFLQLRMINAGIMLDRFAGTSLIGLLRPGKDLSVGFAPPSEAEAMAVTAVMIVLTVLAATITYRLVEMPALGWFRRRAKAIGKAPARAKGGEEALLLRSDQ